MTTRKFISILLTLFMLLAAFAVTVYADTTLEFSVESRSTAPGATVSVPLNLVSSGKTDAIACYLDYDADYLSYVDYEIIGGPGENDISIDEVEDGRISIAIISTRAYDGTLFSFNFTVNDLSGEPSAVTYITPVYTEEGCYDASQEEIPESSQTFLSGTVTISSEHSAPVIGGVEIAGSGKYGEELSVTVTGFSDIWDLTPVYSYEWSRNGVLLSESETYTPSVFDIGKTITVSVKATVEADENPESEAATAEIEIADNDENPAVRIIKASGGATVYRGYLDGDNAIVIIKADGLDPAENKIFVGDAELYYVASRDYFTGVVPTYESKAALVADIIVMHEPSDRIVYGKNPEKNIDSPINNSDYITVKKLALKSITDPGVKLLLSADVGGGVPNGAINSPDYIAVKRVALKKDEDLAINITD